MRIAVLTLQRWSKFKLECVELVQQLHKPLFAEADGFGLSLFLDTKIMALFAHGDQSSRYLAAASYIHSFAF